MRPASWLQRPTPLLVGGGKAGKRVSITETPKRWTLAYAAKKGACSDRQVECYRNGLSACKPLGQERFRLNVQGAGFQLL